MPRKLRVFFALRPLRPLREEIAAGTPNSHKYTINGQSITYVDFVLADCVSMRHPLCMARKLRGQYAAAMTICSTGVIGVRLFFWTTLTVICFWNVQGKSA